DRAGRGSSARRRSPPRRRRSSPRRRRAGSARRRTAGTAPALRSSSQDRPRIRVPPGRPPRLVRMTQRPAAVLWDMDGTLVDTEPYWLVAERELVASWGGTWTLEDGLSVVGSGLEHTASVIRSHGVQLPIPAIIESLTDIVLAQVREHLPWRPGARELL